MKELPRWTHIALRVINIERTAHFYKEYTGLELIHQRQENKTRVGWLGNPSVNHTQVIVLLEMPYEQCSQPSFDHIGLDLGSKEEVDQVADKARVDGILELEPEDHGPIAGYLCMVRDPDGNRVEFSYGQEVESVLENKSAT